MVSQFVGRVVILMGGAGAGATLMENKGSLGDLSRSVMGVLWGGGGGSDRNLTNKVDSLTQEMRQLMARGGNSGTSTIVVQGNGGGGVMRYALYLSVPGVGVYLYMKMKGYGLADIQWVSATRFQEAVEVLGKAQEVLDTKIVAFRVSAEQALAAFRSVAETKFGRIEGGVQDVDTRVQSVDTRVQDVDTRVQRLEGKLDDQGLMLTEASRRISDQGHKMDDQRLLLTEASNQLAYSNQGMNLLCSVVAESFGSQNQSDSMKKLQSFAASGPARVGNTDQTALEGPPVLVEIINERSSPPLLTMSALPNPVMTMHLGVLGGAYAEVGKPGNRSSANLSQTYPPGNGGYGADNPPEPVT